VAYLQSYRGDYGRVQAMRGDPSIFGTVFRGIKSVGSGIIRAVAPPPVRAIANIIAPKQSMPGGRPMVPVPGIRGAAQRAVPGGQSGYQVAPKRRRMNPGNAKALRRAIRRQESFVKLAKKALKGTKYTITTRGASSRRSVKVSEHGPGGVTVR